MSEKIEFSQGKFGRARTSRRMEFSLRKTNTKSLPCRGDAVCVFFPLSFVLPSLALWIEGIDGFCISKKLVGLFCYLELKTTKSIRVYGRVEILVVNICSVNWRSRGIDVFIAGRLFLEGWNLNVQRSLNGRDNILDAFPPTSRRNSINRICT